MSLKYIEYEEEMKAFYQRSASYRNGRCIQIHGLPGAGVNSFVDAFIHRYGERLESEEQICCCVLQCPKDHPKTLFIEIVRESAEAVIRMMERKTITSSQQQYLKELKELIESGGRLKKESEAELKDIEDHVKKVAELCRNFADKVNIRLFIKNFDRSKKLFQKEINYALLFKSISENYSEWLGITITMHRTLEVIALIIEAFSEFATLYEHFTIKGFHECQMEEVFRQMEENLGILLNGEAREQIGYYCGNNPKRLVILLRAMEDLQCKMPEEQLSQMKGDEFVRQSFHYCDAQMKNHLERIMRCADDLPGDGRKILWKALYGIQSGDNSSLQKYLFEMEILTSDEEVQSDKRIFATIPILEEEVMKMGIKQKELEQTRLDEVEGQREVLRILHLSDLHFGSDGDEDDRELRKEYINSFYNKLRGICRKKSFQYIFVTGDIGYRAQEDDYVQAEKFIGNVLKICGLHEDRLFLCPGNHDVARASNEDYHYPCDQKEADRMLALNKLERNTEWFQEYNSLCKSLKCLPYKIGDHENYLTGVRFCEDCTIVCLNTAWLSQEKKEKVWVGKSYPIAIKNGIEESYDQDPKRKEFPVIAMMHHPSTYWEEQDSSCYQGSINVWGTITKMSDVVLCGHSHETSELSYTVQSARICIGGAFYQDYTYRNSFYIYEIGDKKCSKIRYQRIDEEWMEISEE